MNETVGQSLKFPRAILLLAVPVDSHKEKASSSFFLAWSQRKSIGLNLRLEMALRLIPIVKLSTLLYSFLV